MPFPHEGFHGAVRESVESERDNQRVEADFSIWREYGPSKRHYRMHDVWCLDRENMKDFLESVWDYQAKNTTLRFVTSLNVP